MKKTNLILISLIALLFFTMDARAAMPDFAAIKQDFVTRFMTKKEAKVAKPKPVKVTKKPKAPKEEWKFDFGKKFVRPVSKQSFDVQVAQKKVATARNARVAFGDNTDFQNKSIEEMKLKFAKKKVVEPLEQATKLDTGAFVHQASFTQPDRVKEIEAPLSIDILSSNFWVDGQDIKSYIEDLSQVDGASLTDLDAAAIKGSVAHALEAETSTHAKTAASAEIAKTADNAKFAASAETAKSAELATNAKNLADAAVIKNASIDGDLKFSKSSKIIIDADNLLLSNQAIGSYIQTIIGSAGFLSA